MPSEGADRAARRHGGACLSRSRWSRRKVVADLQDGLKLSSFVPHPTITDDEVNGYQELVFFIDTTSSAKLPSGRQQLRPDQEFRRNYVPASAEPYSADRIDRVLPLGGVQEWKLQSYFASHPFHIHVNPFQIVKIIDPNGKDVSVPGAVDDADPTRRRSAISRS